MLSYHLLVSEHGQLFPTVAGILLFSERPHYFFSEASILCNHFSGLEGRISVAARDCEGTLFEQFENAYQFIISRLNYSFEISGPQRTETLEIPAEAIREALINAIVHRNYHVKSPIKIAIYDNRIEIFSPGDFPGPFRFNQFLQGITFLRNMAICRVFREAGYVEKLGTGFITIFASYKARQLKTPQIIEGDNFVKCILPREKESALAEKSETGAYVILHLFETSPEISVLDVITHCHISRASAVRWLGQLCKAGRIERIGRGKATRYRCYERS